MFVGPKTALHIEELLLLGLNFIRKYFIIPMENMKLNIEKKKKRRLDKKEENNDSQTPESEDVDSSIDEVDAIDDVEYETSEGDDTSVQEEIDIDREFFEQDFAKSNQPYYAFTDKFDEVINASDLGTEQEIRRLREQLDRFI